MPLKYLKLNMLGYLLGFNSETILDSIDFSKTYNLTYLGLTT
jgi:hypothetical protein